MGQTSPDHQPQDTGPTAGAGIQNGRHMMQDYWNDPPEQPETPDCSKSGCGGVGDWVRDTPQGQVVRCCQCGTEQVVEWDVDPEDAGPQDQETEIDPTPPEQPARCPHGAEWGDCGACDHLGDLEYDAARERGRI